MPKLIEFYTPDYKYRYVIYNTYTEYILYETNDFKRAKHIWNHIPKRKNGNLRMCDTQTGEIIKEK